MLDITEYKESIRGTGGGPMFHLKPLYEKIMLNIIGTDNPALAVGENIQEDYEVTLESPNALQKMSTR